LEEGAPKKHPHCTSESFILDPADYNERLTRQKKQARQNTSILQVSKERESLYRVFPKAQCLP